MTLADNLLFSLADNAGLAVFAASGALLAAQKKMDLFGALVLAVVTAVGGGTLRDLLTGQIPVFWLRDSRPIWIALGAAVFTFILGHAFTIRKKWLLLPDAVGLALYTWVGCEKAAAAGLPGISIVLIGIITGTAGGMIRDILSGQIPSVCVKGELYATASLAGGLVFVLCRNAALLTYLAAFACMATVLAVRLAAIYWKISVPVYKGQMPD